MYYGMFQSILNLPYCFAMGGDQKCYIAHQFLLVYLLYSTLYFIYPRYTNTVVPVLKTDVISIFGLFTWLVALHSPSPLTIPTNTQRIGSSINILGSVLPLHGTCPVRRHHHTAQWIRYGLCGLRVLVGEGATNGRLLAPPSSLLSLLYTMPQGWGGGGGGKLGARKRVRNKIRLAWRGGQGGTKGRRRTSLFLLLNKIIPARSGSHEDEEYPSTHTHTHTHKPLKKGLPFL